MSVILHNVNVNIKQVVKTIQKQKIDIHVTIKVNVSHAK